MRHKKPLLISLAALFFLFYCYQIVLSFSSSPPVGRTNAPGESNCTTCHTGVLNSGSGGVTYTFGNSDTAYNVGQTYSLTVTVTDPFLTRFGFQMTALTGNNTTTPGNFVIVNGANTSTTSGPIMGNTRQYIGHFNANMNNTWTFNWTAPGSDVGPITFYLVGNASNNLGNRTGDEIYDTTFTIGPPPLLAPTAAFSTSITSICPGSTVSFTDQSLNGPTSWAWSFPGGTPASSSATNPTITYAVPGNYDVTLIASNAVGNDTLTLSGLVTVLDTPSVTLDQTTSPMCGGDSTGSILITPSGGAAPLSFQWSNFASTEDLINIPGGTYSLTVTDNNLCVGTAGPFTLSNPAPVAVTIDSVQSSSCGDSTGAIFASGSGGTGSLSFSWNNGGTSPNLNNLSQGAYAVTVIDSNGCSATNSATVLDAGAPTINATVVDLQCAFGEEGSISVSPMGGTPPYSYLWNTGDTTNMLSGLDGGIYTVVVTDSVGCTVSDSLEVIEPPLLATTVSSQPESQPGALDGKAWVTTSGGVPAYIYEWSTNPIQTGDTAFGLAGGTYTVEVEDENECKKMDTVVVDQLMSREIDLLFASLKLYPNPANEAVFLAYNLPMTQWSLIAFSAQGKEVNLQHEEIDPYTLRVPLEGLSSGVYMLRIQTEAGIIWRKFIRQ